MKREGNQKSPATSIPISALSIIFYLSDMKGHQLLYTLYNFLHLVKLYVVINFGANLHGILPDMNLLHF